MSKIFYIVDRDGEPARTLAGLLGSRDLEVEIRSDGDDLLKRFDAERAACVLVGRNAPGLSAVEIRRRLLLRGIAIPVITVDVGPAVVVPPEVLEVVDSAFLPWSPAREGASGLAVGRRTGAPPTARSAQMEGPETFPSLDVLRERFERLTSRERQVAKLVAQGYSSKELARELNLSKRTVDNHRAHILEKLQLANSVQVTRFLSMLPAAPL